MQILDLIMLVLAIRDIVDIWKNGSIFEEQRAIVEAHDGEEVECTWRNLPYNLVTCYGKLWQLLVCAYCLSRQVALLLALGICVLDVAPVWLAIVIRTIVYGFAAAQVSWMLNIALPKSVQYDRPKPLPGASDDSSPAPVPAPAKRPRPHSLLRRDIQAGNDLQRGAATRRAGARLYRFSPKLARTERSSAGGDDLRAGPDVRPGAEPPTGPADSADAGGPEQPNR